MEPSLLGCRAQRERKPGEMKRGVHCVIRAKNLPKPSSKLLGKKDREGKKGIMQATLRYFQRPSRVLLDSKLEKKRPRQLRVGKDRVGSSGNVRFLQRGRLMHGWRGKIPRRSLHGLYNICQILLEKWGVGRGVSKEREEKGFVFVKNKQIDRTFWYRVVNQDTTSGKLVSHKRVKINEKN